MLPPALLVLTLLGQAASADPTPIRYVGHQIARGQRKLPVIGDLQTRSDTWVLAELRWVNANTIEIVETACRVRFAGTAGVEISMPEAGVRMLPPVTLQYRRSPQDGLWHGGPWKAGWDSADHDRDGNPGFTIHVDAPMCGGPLYIASDVQAIGRGRFVDGVLTGELKLKLHQKILGAEGACLSAVASDSIERVRGEFAYAAVAPDATCDSLARDGWLDKMLAEPKP